METRDAIQAETATFERSLQIRTRDGAVLGARLVEPPGRAHANVLIIGAVAVPQRFYTGFARHLADRGYRVLSFDYRGVGRSRPEHLRGFRASLSEWIEHDYEAALAFLLEHYGELPSFAVGHSLGGQALPLATGSKLLRAAVTVASQSGYYGHFENRQRMELQLRVVLPALSRAFGYLPGWAGTGEDLPAGVAEEWARWCLSNDYYLESHPEYKAQLSAFDKPLLAYSFSDDSYAPLVNVRWLQHKYESAKLESRHLDPRELGLSQVGHFGFFREGCRPLWDEVEAFFAEQLGRPRSTVRPRAPLAATATQRVPFVSDEEILDELSYGRA
jgi:predicted alpha/beta hydrolase